MILASSYLTVKTHILTLLKTSTLRFIKLLARQQLDLPSGNPQLYMKMSLKKNLADNYKAHQVQRRALNLETRQLKRTVASSECSKSNHVIPWLLVLLLPIPHIASQVKIPSPTAIC